MKFFRRIRQALIHNEKVGKYLLYALGEIMLVVIGILLALQVDNWNDERIEGKQRISYLESIRNDLLRDTTNFGKSIRGYQRLIDRKKILELTDYDSIPTSRLEFLVTPTIVENVPVRTAYLKLMNSNITRLSNNDSLSNRIHDYYTTTFAWFSNILKFDHEFTAEDTKYWTHGQNEFEIETSGLPTFQDEKERRANLIGLISEPRGRNYLKLEYERKLGTLFAYGRMHEIASKLIADIEQEIR